ncbi:YbjN domain-containing protein [Burkholderia sp. Ac-20353]|nr:YbjN domain-containing protein [Burkholderia sp. Ac-20353]
MWTEEDITLENLVAHIVDSGMECKLQQTRILLHTASGIGYLIGLDEERKFIRFMTYLPVAKDASDEQKREREHRLNAEVFMASFWLDGDNDLVVDYPLSYGHGLIPGQFMTIVHRFGSILEHVMGTKNEDGLITLGQKCQEQEQEDGSDLASFDRCSGDGVRLVH